MTALLYAGVAGPLLFIAVFSIAGATRRGYDPWRHFVSQLAIGEGGWVQVVNFLVCGTLMLVFAIGLNAAIEGTRGDVVGPVLFGLFGLALLGAGAFRTDPVLGYPPQASEASTTTGTIHVVAGLVGFASLTAACFVMAWHFAGERGAAGWTIYSIAVGVVVPGGFLASGAAMSMPRPTSGLFQRVSIIAGWTWIAIVALHISKAAGFA